MTCIIELTQQPGKKIKFEALISPIYSVCSMNLYLKPQNIEKKFHFPHCKVKMIGGGQRSHEQNFCPYS